VGDPPSPNPWGIPPKSSQKIFCGWKIWPFLGHFWCIMGVLWVYFRFILGVLKGSWGPVDPESPKFSPAAYLQPVTGALGVFKNVEKNRFFTPNPEFFWR